MRNIFLQLPERLSDEEQEVNDNEAGKGEQVAKRKEVVEDGFR